MTTAPPPDERNRLNRRIRILPKEVALGLKYYRRDISSMAAVQRRHAAVAMIRREGHPGFLEAVDVIPLCHSYLDKHNVPTDPSLDHPKLSSIPGN